MFVSVSFCMPFLAVHCLTENFFSPFVVVHAQAHASQNKIGVSRILWSFFCGVCSRRHCWKRSILFKKFIELHGSPTFSVPIFTLIVIVLSHFVCQCRWLAGSNNNFGLTFFRHDQLTEEYFMRYIVYYVWLLVIHSGNHPIRFNPPKKW